MIFLQNNHKDTTLSPFPLLTCCIMSLASTELPGFLPETATLQQQGKDLLLTQNTWSQITLALLGCVSLTSSLTKYSRFSTAFLPRPKRRFRHFHYSSRNTALLFSFPYIWKNGHCYAAACGNICLAAPRRELYPYYNVGKLLRRYSPSTAFQESEGPQFLHLFHWHVPKCRS